MGEPRKLDFSWPVITKLIFIAALVWAWLKLWPLALMLLVAIVLAVAFDPPIGWLEKRRVPRAAGVVALGFLLLAASVFFVWIVFPPLVEQGRRLLGHLRGFQNQLYLLAPPPMRATVREQVEQLMQVPAEGASSRSAMLAAGGAVVSALAAAVFTFVLTLYFVAEGRQVYAWLVAFVPRVRRPKVKDTAEQISKVIFAYITGQVITSVICSIYAFAILKLLHVPAALVLALVAGCFDILPALGFILAVVPAMLMAATVSGLTVLWVFLLYVLYHMIENYLIVPQIYGDRLRLSTLAVLIALAVGGELAGVVGAVLVLPLVAAYPIVERLWLSEQVGSEALRDHQALDVEPPAKVVQQIIDGSTLSPATGGSGSRSK